MNKLLLVIDLQNDFINDNTKFLKERIKHLIDSKQYDNVVFTQFLNSKTNRCFTELNWNGCLTEEGSAIAINAEDNLVLKKDKYTCLNDELINYIKQNNIDEIYLAGIDTECCVLKTAYDLFENNYKFYVLKDYCASVHGTTIHNQAIGLLKRNIGKDKII